MCDICTIADIKIPEEVAVLGVDDDEYFCNLTNPLLTSVKVPGEQVGYEAMKLLDAFISGAPTWNVPKNCSLRQLSPSSK